ncbi:elongation factor G [Seohaeicola zhoushanensis]|uniref:Elongation factor G n=1 Tax=Seohaeicola zhoushanensis TaxID=1569283 RepID=A0A8J3GVY0_9RHOB|nr:elongation factor G [Seohaeicola zhoushanensis]GHF42012.1 elongation factor G [Seohaeicola zhoushanensis]
MKVIAVVGPSQAGKTTVIEALASLEEQHPQRLALAGDAAVTRFGFMGESWAALDLPGGPDSLAQVGPALMAADAAVLVVPADTEAAVLAAPYLRLLEASGLSTFVFINRIDAATDRVRDIVAALQVYCQHGIVLRQIPMRKGDRVVGAVDLISERAWEYHDNARSSLVEMPPEIRDREAEARMDFLEHLADFDDALMEQLIEDQKPMTEDIYRVATQVLQHHDLVPALLGSAAHGKGVLRLMKSLRHEVPDVEQLRERLPEGVLAVGCMADAVKHLGKTVLVRAVAPGVGPGASLAGASVGSFLDLDARAPVGALEAGGIGLAVKSDHLSADTPLFTATGAHPVPEGLRPRTANHRFLVTPANERDETRLATALARLSEIDPGLALLQHEGSGHTVLCTQGPLHLRRLVDKLTGVFGIEVQTVEIPAALCETIARKVEKHHRHRKQSGGAGQFADVLIEVMPLARGEGFRFGEQIKGGAIPKNYIPSVEAGARDALSEGPNGHPVVDLGVLLKDGKFHAVDSSDFAFRTAGRNAVREALAEAGTVVLQPINRVTIRVPTVYSGGLVPLVSALKGQVVSFEADPEAAGWDAFHALLPVSAEAELFNALGGATRGTAWYSSELDHYEELREPPRRAAG